MARARGRSLTVLVAVLGAAAGAVVPASGLSGPDGHGHGQARTYEVGLFGDMPYGDVGRAEYPAVIADLNRHDLAFSLFDGDIKNGSEPCYADVDGSARAAGKPDVYRYALGFFNQLEAPVVVTPGDNEWTDCDRTKIVPAFDANGRLAYERKVFYPSDQTLGQRTMTVTRQSPQYPENARWTRGPVTYIAVNIPGSDNNWVDPVRDGTAEGPAEEAQAEYTARNAANLAWLDEGFATAEASGSKAVMIVTQADMWDPAAEAGGKLVHYEDTKRALARLTIAFGGPVALVNGDSHSFKVTKPLTDAATTSASGEEGPNVIQSFTQVTTFGDAQDHWVSATVDARDPQVFTFRQRIVAANTPDYTPPAPFTS